MTKHQISQLKLQSFLQQSPELFGIVLKIISVICFSIMTGLIKYLNDVIAVEQVVFFRSAIAIFPLIIFLIIMGHFPKGLKTTRPWGHFKRCLIGTVAMFFTFSALNYLPFAEATAISYLSPIILVFLAVFLLNEKLNARRVLGVLLGMLGLAIMTVPKFSASGDTNTLIGVALALISAILIALALLQVRQLTQMGENPATIAFYFTVISSILSLFTAVLGNWQIPTLTQWIYLISIGLFGGIAQICLSISFKYAEASALAPYDYLSILLAVIFGFFFFDEIPDLIFWVGMPLIILGAIVAKPKSQKTNIKNK